MMDARDRIAETELLTQRETIDQLRRELVEVQVQLHQQHQATEPQRTEISALRLKLQHAEADAKNWKQQHDRVERDYRQAVVERDYAKQQRKEDSSRATAVDTERLRDIEKLTQRVVELEMEVQVQRAKSTKLQREVESVRSSSASTVDDSSVAMSIDQNGNLTFGGKQQQQQQQSSASFRNDKNSSNTTTKTPMGSFDEISYVPPPSSSSSSPSNRRATAAGGTGTTSSQQLFLLQTENDSMKMRCKTLDAKVDQLNRTVRALEKERSQQQDTIRHMQYRQHDLPVVANPSASNDQQSQVPVSVSPSRGGAGSSSSSKQGITTATRFDLAEHEKLRNDFRTGQQDLRRVKGQLEELQRVHHLTTSNNMSLRGQCERFMADNAGLEQQLMQSRHSRDLLKMHVDAILKSSNQPRQGSNNSSLRSGGNILDRDTSALQIAKDFDTAFNLMSLEHFAGVGRLEQEQLRLMNSLLLDRAQLLEHQLGVGASDRLKLEREVRELKRELTLARDGEPLSENVSPIKKRAGEAAADRTNPPSPVSAHQHHHQQPSPISVASALDKTSDIAHDGGWQPLPLLQAHEKMKERMERELLELQRAKTQSDMHSEAVARTANSRVNSMLEAGRFHLLGLSHDMKQQLFDCSVDALQARSIDARSDSTQQKLEQSEEKAKSLEQEVGSLKAAVAETDKRIADARALSDEIARATMSGASELAQTLHESTAAGVRQLSERLSTSLYPFFSESAATALLGEAKPSKMKLPAAVVQLALLDVGSITNTAEITSVFQALTQAASSDVAFATEQWKTLTAGVAGAIARADLEHGEMVARGGIEQGRLADLVKAAQKHSGFFTSPAAAAAADGSNSRNNNINWSIPESPQRSPRAGSPSSSPTARSMFAARRNAAPPQAPATPPRMSQQQQQQQHAEDDDHGTSNRNTGGAAGSQILRNAAASNKAGPSASSSSASTLPTAISIRQFTQISQNTLVTYSSSLLQHKRDLAKHFLELMGEVGAAIARMRRDSTYALDIAPVRRDRDAALSELASANRAAFDLLETRKEFEARVAALVEEAEKERQLKDIEREKNKGLEMEVFTQKERVLRMEGEATDLRFALHQRDKKDSNQESAVVATMSEQQRTLMQRKQDLEREKMKVELSLADRVNEIRELRKRATEAEKERDEHTEKLRQQSIDLEMRDAKIDQLRREGNEAAGAVESFKMHLQQEQMKLEQTTRQLEEWRATAQDLQRRIEVDENLMGQIIGGGSPAWLNQHQGTGGLNDSRGAFGSGMFSGGGGGGGGASPSAGGEIPQQQTSASDNDGGSSAVSRELPPVELAAVKNAQRAMVDMALERSKLEARIEAAKKEGVNSVAELRRAWDAKNNALEKWELQLKEQNERLDAFCAAVLERMNMATNSERHHRMKCDTLVNVNEELRRMAGMFLRKVKMQAAHLRGFETLHMSRADPIEFPRNDIGTQTLRSDTVAWQETWSRGKRNGKNQQQQQDMHVDDSGFASSGGPHGARHAQGGRDLLTLLIEVASQLHGTHIVAGFPASALLLAAAMGLFSLVTGWVWATQRCVAMYST